MKKNVMIIGAGGSLGKVLCGLLIKNDYYGVVAVDINENSAAYLCRVYNISSDKIYIENILNFDKLKIIIEYHDIDTVVNCAALKHVMWCEFNVRNAIEVNTLANLELINYLSKQGKDFIYISSDKAVNPKNVYALTKQFTDYIVNYYNFKVVRGVNFLNSNGSVLDIWDRQRIIGEPFTIVKEKKCNRYFITLNQMAQIVREAIDNDNIKEYKPKVVYKIYIKDLFEAYLNLNNIFSYEIKEIHLSEIEKISEDLGFSPEIIELNKIPDIVNLLKNKD